MSSDPLNPLAPPRPLAASRGVREFWVVAVISAIAALLRFAWAWYAITHFGVKKVYGGFEVAFVGAALARGYGFSSLYGVPSGPTATFAPLYPLLVGAAFRCFHVYSAPAAWCLFAVNIACEALTVAALYWIGRRCFSPMVAFAGALFWAIDFAAIAYSSRIWYSSISALTATLAVAGFLHLLDSLPRRRDWIAYGFFWGFAAMINTALILMMPLSIAALFYRWGRQLRWHALTALLVFACALTPWTIRNYVVFHKLIPIRGNFGAMLWYGNHPDVQGPADESMNPTQNWDELQTYLRMGDAPYAASRQQMAVQFIRQNPAEFVHLTRNRFDFFWAAGSGWSRLGPACWSILAFAGLLLMLRHNPLRAAAFAGPLLIYPLPYYVTLASTFFRYPINPIMTLLVLYTCFTLADTALPSKSQES
jgi:Dolichyl-phosphate-mannose-protein mannosyltransferase